jgi:integrase
MVLELLQSGALDRFQSPTLSAAPEREVVDRILGASDEPAAPHSHVPVELPPAPTVPALVPQPASGGAPSRLLSELVKIHLGNMARTPRKSATDPVRDRKYPLDMLLAVIGDKPIEDVTPADAERFADVLAAWPVNARNQKGMEGLSVLEIARKAKKTKLPSIKRSTQRKHIQSLDAFFNWLVDDTKDLAENPFRFIQTSRYKDLEDPEKQPFDDLDLDAIFDRKRTAVVDQPHQFWAPVIAMYSSMRVNEIGQLRVADIRTDTVRGPKGQKHVITYFDITDKGEGQSVKTENGKRQVPVHSKLIELGFLRYVEDVRASGCEHLFPGLAWGEGGPGRVIGRWFNKSVLRRACRISDRKKTFHCFRHTFTTLADRGAVVKTITRTINGHSTGTAVDDKSYVRKGTLLECQTAIEQLDFPVVDHEPYVSERFRPYLIQAAARARHGDRLREEGLPVVARKGRPPKLASLAP